MATGIRTTILDHRGEYGFDGNIVGTWGMTAAGVLLLVIAAILHAGGEQPLLALAALVVGAAFLLTTGIALHTTRRGKFAVWAEILESLQLSGDERVLDVGCGRGAVLTMVAKLLPRGGAVGIDLWNKADQSGNGPAAVERNLHAEGVRDRCEIVTGDMRSMPFPDAAFDLIVSSIAIHNIPDRAGRSQAIAEIARVLKPSGRMVLADLAWTRTYAAQLETLELVDVRRRSLGWRFWWIPLFLGTWLVTATKPGR